MHLRAEHVDREREQRRLPSPERAAMADGGVGHALAGPVRRRRARAACRPPARPRRAHPGPPAAVLGVEHRPRRPGAPEADVPGVVVRAIRVQAGRRAVTAREEVLRRIRTALADPSPATPAVGVPRDYRAAGQHQPGSPALLELLTDRLVDYKATVLACSPAELPAVVAGALAERGLRRIVAPDAVPAAWLEGLHVLRDGASTLPVADLDAADGVVTGCAVAVAETGTIVLDAGPDQGRRALTLVPDAHVVVVRAGQVVQTVPEALAAPDARPPADDDQRARPPPATSSSTGSKASTAPGP